MSVRNVLLNNCHEYGIDLHSPVHGIHQVNNVYFLFTSSLILESIFYLCHDH